MPHVLPPECILLYAAGDETVQSSLGPQSCTKPAGCWPDQGRLSLGCALDLTQWQGDTREWGVPLRRLSNFIFFPKSQRQHMTEVNKNYICFLWFIGQKREKATKKWTSLFPLSKTEASRSLQMRLLRAINSALRVQTPSYRDSPKECPWTHSVPKIELSLGIPWLMMVCRDKISLTQLYQDSILEYDLSVKVCPAFAGERWTWHHFLQRCDNSFCSKPVKPNWSLGLIFFI